MSELVQTRTPTRVKARSVHPLNNGHHGARRDGLKISWRSRDVIWKESLERAKGIEPSYAAWEAAVLPLNYARDRLPPHCLDQTARSAKPVGGEIPAS